MRDPHVDFGAQNSW